MEEPKFFSEEPRPVGDVEVRHAGDEGPRFSVRSRVPAGGRLLRPAESESDPPAAPPEAVTEPAFRSTSEARVEEFSIRSERLSQFWNEDIEISSTIVLPPGAGSTPDDRVPVVFYVHGYGTNGSETGQMFWRALEPEFAKGSMQRMALVFLDASFRTGHHVFADSANNGPWATALIEEFLPALERAYPVVDAPHGRFLTGHSSGGWSTLWLQINYPVVFGGTWATSPDPVDFHNFVGVNLYAWDNVYRDPDGQTTRFMREGDEWTMSFEDYVRQDRVDGPFSGVMDSFDAVFGARREDGMPAPMFDRETGTIDPAVVESWKPYDIVRLLRERWTELGPLLDGKLHVFVGTHDEFRLDESCRLLDAELARLGSRERVVFIEGRGHFNLYDPVPEQFPNGLYPHMFAAMWSSYVEATGGSPGE
jgi:enterochelin esterase-like enzyme